MSDKYAPIREISEEAYQLTLKVLSGEAPNGHYDFSDGAYANVFYGSPKPLAECKYEAHRKMIDVQMILEGKEIIGIEPLEVMRRGECTMPFSEEKDAEVWSHNDDGTHHVLGAGDYLIILPEHAHMPGALADEAIPRVRKMIIKAPVTLLKK